MNDGNYVYLHECNTYCLGDVHADVVWAARPTDLAELHLEYRRVFLDQELLSLDDASEAPELSPSGDPYDYRYLLRWRYK